jgi:hypothetical protein
VRELTAGGYPCLAARNVPDDDTTAGKTWVETSVLVLDMTLGLAREFATRYGQVAFVWIDRQATPQLVTTAAGSPLR